MSDLAKKIKLALESAKAISKNIASGADLRVTDKVFNARMDVCRACPKFNANMARCDECGCFLQVKAKLAGMLCPLDSWKE